MVPVKTLIPIQDAYVSQYYANQNFAFSPFLYFGQYKQTGDDYRTLLQFPLRAIPKHRRIELAQLQFTVYRNEFPTGTLTYSSLKRPLEPWYAGTVTWNNQPKAKLVYTFLSSWADTPGTVIYNDITFLVRSWLDGSKPNYGLLLEGDESTNALLGLFSSDRQHPGFFHPGQGFKHDSFGMEPRRYHHKPLKKHPGPKDHDRKHQVHGPGEQHHVPPWYTGPKLIINYC
ncbi:MAG: DNRLRE domain-containing protein [Syntrophomonas sp.]